MNDLNRRFVASAISIALVLFCLLFSFHEWLRYVVVVLIAGLTCVAVWEYEQFAKAKGGQMILPVLLVCAFLEAVSFFAASLFPTLHSVPIMIFFLSLLVLFALHFRENDGAIVDLSFSSFGLLYIAVPMGMMLGILYHAHGVDGRLWLAYLLIVTKMSDVGAYFAGNLWGKRKLAPTISPGKTIEGAIFGLVVSSLFSFLFCLVCKSFGWQGFYLGTWGWLWMGLILGAMGQFGDLSESLLKRDAKKKDSNALPGLGGILDAVDSLLFNAPIVYLYLNYTNV